MTTTVDLNLAGVVDEADPNKISDALRLVKLGTLLTPQGRTITQPAAATVTLDPPAMGPASVSARVTAGAAAAGRRDISDSGDTPSATLATLSDDGATLTFEADVTDVVVDYLPRPAADMAGDFPQTGNG